MKITFIDALEQFLVVRDELKRVLADGNSAAWERRNASVRYDEYAYRLEEAHKISLLDIIEGDK